MAVTGSRRREAILGARVVRPDANASVFDRFDVRKTPLEEAGNKLHDGATFAGVYRANHQTTVWPLQ